MARRAALSMERVLSEAREEMRQAADDWQAVQDYWEANHCCCCTGECATDPDVWEAAQRELSEAVYYGEVAPVAVPVLV